jgi:hypothetical protein
MRHPNAVSLAKRLIDSRLKRNGPSEEAVTPAYDISDEQMEWAMEILATHLDACMRQGIPNRSQRSRRRCARVRRAA